MSINEYRSRIDSIDNEIVALLVKRLRLVEQIHAEKCRTGLNITDDVREREIVARLSANNSEYTTHITSVMEKIIHTCKLHQINLNG